ncbi:hypothetical protein QBC38DRAFT_269871 [Podospora fimiseda]|uniref:Uncharacterized protein n=1 Tax=Podospora fimiseda TaxID=252190 RepID=A0AAN7BL12_9PEZI|nr:hypothetical protein QBC38DRAFT_269871 [Podospora fimiseda]
MDETNGTVKSLRPNGNVVNGIKAVNGAMKPANLNGNHTAGQRKGTVKKPARAGIFYRILSLIARLLTWYSIITILFRCPATLDACDEISPSICKQYFQLKQTVTPHLEPYYDAYAAPYVDVIRPHYDTATRTVSPVWQYAKTYSAPRVQQAQAYGKEQWDKNIHPQLSKYQTLLRAKYDDTLSPHLAQVSTTVGPYYEIARTNTLQTYHELILPSYQFLEPYIQHGYEVTSTFTKERVVPSVVWAWDKTYIFLDGTIWPQIRVIYIENVEPQLVKIGKRLGRYSSGKKTIPKSMTDSAQSPSAKTTSSFTRPAPSVAVSSSLTASSIPASVTVAASAKKVPVDQGAKKAAGSNASSASATDSDTDEQEDESPARRETREIVAADLKDWQERYTKAADEGAAEIDERVQEIAKKMIRRNAKVTGRGLLEQLSEISVDRLTGLRGGIIELVGEVKQGIATPEQAQEEIIEGIRNAGLAVKNKAQEIRSWREQYEAEIQLLITKAAETHFAILENIRDLALQKIGMKWAWMDGVTYKDWAKYHLLKSRFDEWKGDLESLIVNHPNLVAAQVEGANIEEEAMKLAASTARELARLKQVGNWKIAAGDESEEFDSTLMQQAAEAAESAKIAAANAIHNAAESVENAKEAVVGNINGVNAASEAVAKATDVIVDSKGSVVEGAKQAVESVKSAASFSVTSDETVESAQQSIGAASEEISNVVKPTSEVTPNSENDISKPNESPEPVIEPEFASAVIIDTPAIVDNITKIEADVKADPAPVELPIEDQEGSAAADDSFEAKPASDPMPSVKPALFGAAAQWVPSRVPILDDHDDDDDDDALGLGDLVQELKSGYSAAVSKADSQYSRALSAVSAKISGTPQPAHEKILASITAAYSNAMVSASARMDSALKAASAQVRGTPTKKPRAVPLPTVPSVEWSAIESIAAERLAQGRAWAEEQYESARIAIGLATPTPSTPAEHVSKLLDNAKHNYYAGLGVAYARYSEFLDAASSALSSVTATPTPTDLAGTASSILSAANESAASAASAASEKAASAASAAAAAASVAGDNVSSVAAAGYDQAAAAADFVADGWDVIVTKISIQVYGAPTPTPWYEAAYSGLVSATSVTGDAAASVTSAAAVASDSAVVQYAAISSIVSELLVGKEPSFSESVVSKLKQAYATGSAVVGDAGEKVKSVGEKVASAVGEGAEAAKQKVVGHDEL